MALPTYLNGGALSDYLQALRMAVQNHTPGLSTALSLDNPIGLAISGAANAQAGVLNNHQPQLSPQGRVNHGFGAMANAPAAPATPQVPDWLTQQTNNAMEPTMSPNARVAQDFQSFAPWMPHNNPSQGFPGGARPPVVAQGGDSVPMPQARPADAPQAPPGLNFFQRNAAMMKDPSTGQFIDPAGAALAQASFPSPSATTSGPGLINKMMAYLHGKAGNDSDDDNS